MRWEEGAAGTAVVACEIAFNASGWLAFPRLAIDGASAEGDVPRVAEGCRARAAAGGD